MGSYALREVGNTCYRLFSDDGFVSFECLCLQCTFSPGRGEGCLDSVYILFWRGKTEEITLHLKQKVVRCTRISNFCGKFILQTWTGTRDSFAKCRQALPLEHRVWLSKEPSCWPQNSNRLFERLVLFGAKWNHPRWRRYDLWKQNKKKKNNAGQQVGLSSGLSRGSLDLSDYLLSGTVQHSVRFLAL